MTTTIHVHGDHGPAEVVETLRAIMLEDGQSGFLLPHQLEVFKDILNSALVAERRELMHRDSREGYPF